MATYVLITQSEINLKISKSDLLVSSKPGVSTREISESSISEIENLKTDISLVQDSKPCPAIPLMPETTSMNYIVFNVWSINCVRKILTVLLPEPLGPMRLEIGSIFQGMHKPK